MEMSRNHRKIPSHHRMYSPASSRHVCTSFADQSKCIRNLFVFLPNKQTTKACQYRYPVAPGFCLISNNQKLVSTGILRVTKKWKIFWFFNNLSATSSFSVNGASVILFLLLPFRCIYARAPIIIIIVITGLIAWLTCLSPNKNCLGEEKKKEPWGGRPFSSFVIVILLNEFRMELFFCVYLICIYIRMCVCVCIPSSINTWTSHRETAVFKNKRCLLGGCCCFVHSFYFFFFVTFLENNGKPVTGDTNIIGIMEKLVLGCCMSMCVYVAAFVTFAKRKRWRRM